MPAQARGEISPATVWCAPDHASHKREPTFGQAIVAAHHRGAAVQDRWLPPAAGKCARIRCTARPHSTETGHEPIDGVGRLPRGRRWTAAGKEVAVGAEE